MDITFIIIFLVIAAIAIAILRRRKTAGGPQTLYKQHGALFTPAERSFLGVLDQATAGHYRVFGKVRVADVLAPATSDQSRRLTLLNKIIAKHFDYVLCDPRTLDVKAVVELNDKSHNSKTRTMRDNFLRASCESAGLPLIEIPAKRRYSIEAVKRRLNDAIAGPQAVPYALARIEPTF
jgi:hypothetical protein